MRNRRARACWIAVAALGAVTTASSPSWAWKPYTHVYLAQQAYQDAVDDGYITIYATDRSTGKPAVDAAKKPIVQGRYKVQERLLVALRASPAKYFAGVLGPDAYPDILTGQMRIHPPGAEGNVPDTDANGPGTDAWLQQIWRKAWEDGSNDAIAFAAGFLAHAAGDIYAHTFMNTFAGGIFDMFDMRTLNWFKHITVEGYVGERTPELSTIPQPGKGRFLPPPLNVFDIVRDHGITGIEGFIADNTWDVRDANGTAFPHEDGKYKSVTYHLATFLDTVTHVNADVRNFDAALSSDLAHAAYNASPVGTGREVDWACGGSTCPDRAFSSADCPDEYLRGAGVCVGMGFGGALVWMSAWGTLAGAYGIAYTAENPIARAIEAWTGNAMQTTPFAMQDWVSASHNTAIHLFFSPDHAAHLDVGDGYGAFKNDMLSITTGLDRTTVQGVSEMIDFIMTPVTALKAAVGEAERWVAEQVFQSMFHMTMDQARECFAKPHLWMNPLLRNNAKGMPATLASMNQLMRLPTIVPATCAGPTTQCTIAPGLIGTDVTGACDIMAGGPVAKFTVRPEESVDVFPAAYNSVNMIKLSLIDPVDVSAAATALAGEALVVGIPAGGPAPPNAMLGFAATIDGSHEWRGRRNGNEWNQTANQDMMVLARNCNAYWGVFLDQRPDVDALLAPVADRTRFNPPLLPGGLWEPDDMAPCGKRTKHIVPFPTNIVARLTDTINTTGTAQVTVSEPSRFTLASTGKNAFTSPLTQGSLVVAPDGLSARYVPPKWNPTAKDQIIVTSRDGVRRTLVPVSLATPQRAAFRRDLAKTAVPGKSGDLAGLRAGEAAQLVPAGKLPMTWTLVSGPGSVGDTKLEAAHDAKLAVHKGRLATSDQLLKAQAPKLNDVACKGPCKTQALEGVRQAVGTRTSAAIDLAQTKRQLDESRATYRAPDTITKDEVVTLRGVDAQGGTALVKLNILAPPPPLQVKLASPTLQKGAHMKLDVDAGLPAAGKNPAPGVPMTWKVVAGPGTVGDTTSKEHAQHTAQKRAFLADLEPLNKRLANARPFEIAAARKAWVEHMQANVPKYAPSFAKLDELERTYHAPTEVTGKQRVTLRGVAQDGSGRTVDVSFELTP